MLDPQKRSEVISFPSIKCLFTPDYDVEADEKDNNDQNADQKDLVRMLLE